jgi:hypothetical protein
VREVEVGKKIVERRQEKLVRITRRERERGKAAGIPVRFELLRKMDEKETLWILHVKLGFFHLLLYI